jgi:hypothetical protein
MALGILALGLSACSSTGAISTQSGATASAVHSPRVVVLDPATGRFASDSVGHPPHSMVVVMDPSDGRILWSGSSNPRSSRVVVLDPLTGRVAS